MIHRLLASLTLATLLITLPALKATALVAEPRVFDSPVPEKWRAPFARFLSELGVVDVASTMNASKAQAYPQNFDETGPAKVIFRIVNPNSCAPERDECMTVIGHIDGAVFVVEALFYAGDKISVGDVPPRVIGVQSSKPVSFIGKTSVVSVVNTLKGILIATEPVKPSK